MSEPALTEPPDSASVQESSSKRRTDPRKRPAKSLPTDRMKFEVQVRVLQAAARLSGAGKRPIDAEMLSGTMNGEVSHYTVGLSHQFFVDCGWLEKRGRGEYAASDALIDFNRRLSVASDDMSRAVEPLRNALLQSWFWRAAEGQLAHGAVPISDITIVLMQEAQVGSAHLPQVRNVLEWLRFVGLIGLSDDRVLPVGELAVPSSSGAPAVPAPSSTEELAVVAPASPAVQIIAAKPALPPSSGPTILSFDFAFNLTTADLSELSSDQIRALFEAVGALVAIKASL